MLCCGLRVSGLQALPPLRSSSQSDVEGNTQRTTELIFPSASISGTAAEGVSWGGAPSTDPVRTATASAFFTRHSLSCEAILRPVNRGRSSCGASISSSLITVSVGAARTTLSPSAVLSGGPVRHQAAALDGQVRVGLVHLQDGLIHTGEVAAAGLGLRLELRPAF